MSTYATKRVHPVTGKMTDCIAMDDYFGKHEFGYRFSGESTVYTEDELRAMAPSPYPDN